jgi:hypothetical protein
MLETEVYEKVQNFYFLGTLNENGILRTHKRTKSNSCSDALFRTLTVAPSVGLFCKLATKPNKTDNCPVTRNYVNK